MGSGCTFVAHARPSSAQDERGVPLSGFAAVALRPSAVVATRRNAPVRPEQASGEPSAAVPHAARASQQAARAVGVAGGVFDSSANQLFRDTRGPDSRRVRIRRRIVCSSRACRLARRGSRTQPIANRRGMDGGRQACAAPAAVRRAWARHDAAASFRPRVTDTQHFQPVSPDAGAAPRRLNPACATGIGRAMTLRSLPRQNSHIEAIQCASKDA